MCAIKFIPKGLGCFVTVVKFSRSSCHFTGLFLMYEPLRFFLTKGLCTYNLPALAVQLLPWDTQSCSLDMCAFDLPLPPPWNWTYKDTAVPFLDGISTVYNASSFALSFMWSLLSSVVIKIITKSSPGRKGFISAYNSQGTPRKNLLARQKPGGYGGVQPAPMACLPVYTAFLHHPGPHAEGWYCSISQPPPPTPPLAVSGALQHQSLIQKMPYGLS